MASYIYFVVGSKGSGKSLYDARSGLRIMNHYYKTEKKYPKLKRRIYFSKQKFSPEIERRELIGYIDPKTGAPVKNSGHLAYWSRVDELQYCPRERLGIKCWWGTEPHVIHNMDISWDEIGNDLPPDRWKDNPDWLRQIFSHTRKRQNRVFANAQAYDMVDIHFRRQVDDARMVTKLFGSRDIDATLPDPSFVFVFQMLRFFNPVEIENEKDDRKIESEGWPRFHFYTAKDTEIFDTSFELPPYKPSKLRETILTCEEGENCRDPKHRVQVRHDPI